MSYKKAEYQSDDDRDKAHTRCSFFKHHTATSIPPGRRRRLGRDDDLPDQLALAVPEDQELHKKPGLGPAVDLA